LLFVRTARRHLCQTVTEGCMCAQVYGGMPVTAVPMQSPTGTVH
jgi:hypothetical protein